MCFDMEKNMQILAAVLSAQERPPSGLNAATSLAATRGLVRYRDRELAPYRVFSGQSLGFRIRRYELVS